MPQSHGGALVRPGPDDDAELEPMPTVPCLRRVFALVGFTTLGCNVQALSGDTGGVAPGDGGPCPDGVTIVLSDYRSSQIALATVDGTTLSESFVSTASVKTDGLSFALSGDVVLPKTRPRSGRVVLLDRFGTNVVTWMDPTDGRVLGQLPLGTGFQSNPQDYFEVDAARAYVSRFGHNHLAGREPFDEGSDVLIVDTHEPAIVGRIALPSSSDVPARPGGFASLDARHVVLTLTRLGVTLSTGDDSMLVGLDTEHDRVAWQLELEGLRNCGTARLSPDGSKLAVGCSGFITTAGESLEPEGSGLALLDARSSPPAELARYPALELAGEAIQTDLAFASDETLLFKTQTAVGSAAENRLLALDLARGSVHTLFTADPDTRGAGRGLTLASVVCAPGCSDYCLLADSGHGALQRLRVDARGDVEHVDTLRVERRIGLPPVALGYR